MSSSQSFEEEAAAIHTVKESLEEAWCYFHSGRLPEGSDPTLPPPTVEQTHELLDVYYQLLQSVQEANDPLQRAFVVDASIKLRGVGDADTASVGGGALGGVPTTPMTADGGYYSNTTDHYAGAAAPPLHEGVLPVLANLSIHAMSCAPDILDKGTLTLQDAFGGLRAHALQCIKALILLAATAEDEGNRAAMVKGGGLATEGPPTAGDDAAIIGIGCGSRCTAALIELSLPEDLLVTILPATGLHESVRTAACEVIFAFAFRLPSACHSLIVCHAVPRLLMRLGAERSQTVRVFICSILRLLVTEMPAEALGDGGAYAYGGRGQSSTRPMAAAAATAGGAADSVVAAFVDILLNNNELDDVRVMATEILCSTCKTSVGARQLLTGNNALLSDVLLLAQHIIANADAVPAVVEAMCRLLECMAIAASSLRVVAFFEICATMELEKPLSQNLRRPATEIHVAAAAARALRHFVQWSPPSFSPSSAIISNFPTLSVILKTLLECDRENANSGGAGAGGVRSTANGGGLANSGDDSDLHQQIIAVELAILIALLMAQSPFARTHINSELKQYPSWAHSLLEAVTKFLNSPTLSYYASIDIIDVTNTCINTFNSVAWSAAGKPLKSSVRRLFELQRDRVMKGDGLRTDKYVTAGIGNNNNVPLSSEYCPADEEEEVTARARLTFVLLNFAMALALDGSSADGGVSEGGVGSVGVGGSNPNSAATPSRIRAPNGADISNIAGSATTPRGGRTFPPSMSRYSINNSASVAYGTALINGSVGYGGPPPPQGVGAPAIGGVRRQTLSRQEKEQLMYAYDRFDSAFKLVLRFAKHYERVDRREAVYLPTPDGYMVRQTQLRNPWAKIVKKKRALSWAVGDIKEGDMFYFAVPYEELTLRAIETLIGYLRKHIGMTKKALLITPHSAKGRRSFLYDLQENVLPQTLLLLRRLAALLDDKGESSVRFPIFLFREREIHIGERCLHAGILADVMDQVEYYFMQSAEDQAAFRARPELAADIDAKIAELKARTFTGHEGAVVEPDSDDDEMLPGRGHGGISSDSD